MAAAILVLASLILFMGVRTIANLTLESSRLKTEAGDLSALVVQSDPAAEYTAATIGLGSLTIDGVWATYSLEDGSSFTVFEAAP